MQILRRIPCNLEKEEKEEEGRLLELGVIEKVPYKVATTWWINSVLAQKPLKPDAIRYCSTMKVPNTAIKRPITEALSVDDVKIKLSNANLFSILDMNEAYLLPDRTQQVVK